MARGSIFEVLQYFFFKYWYVNISGELMLYINFLLVLVISRFGFEGAIVVLIAPVHGHCLLVTFMTYY